MRRRREGRDYWIRRTKAAETEAVVLRRRLNALERETSPEANRRVAIRAFESRPSLVPPAGTKVAVYDEEGDHVRDLDLAEDGRLSEPVALAPGEWLVLFVPPATLVPLTVSDERR